jgi:hypothetical protein
VTSRYEYSDPFHKFWNPKKALFVFKGFFLENATYPAAKIE